MRLYGIDAPESKQLCLDRGGREFACGASRHCPFTNVSVMWPSRELCKSAHVAQMCAVCCVLQHQHSLQPAANPAHQKCINITHRICTNPLGFWPLALALHCACSLVAGEQAAAALRKKLGSQQVACEVRPCSLRVFRSARSGFLQRRLS